MTVKGKFQESGAKDARDFVLTGTATLQNPE